MIRDLRKYSRQTNIRLLIGFFFILFFIGDGLIFVFFGKEAAFMGILCLLGGLAPLILIMLILGFIGWIVTRVNNNG
jgi:hypothetical protein